MENRSLVSTHILQSDYSKKGRIKGIIIGWAIFLVIFIISRLPNIQQVLQEVQVNWEQEVEWLGSTAKFIRNGLWVFFVPLTIGTILRLREKRPFQSLNLYKEGIGFICDGNERFCDYAEIEISLGSMAQSFYITCKSLGIKGTSYGFGEFSQSDVLKNNLRRFKAI